MTEHTNVPWAIGDHLGEIEGKMILIGGGKGPTGRPYCLAGVLTFDDEPNGIEEAKANAKRIVACVNACEGIPTGTLNAFDHEKFIVKKSDYHSLIAERDELLESLAEATEQLNAMNCSPAHAVSWIEPRTKTTIERVEKYRNLIAKIRSNQ